MLKIFGCVVEQHDLRLVALSACICGLGCFTTITLMARAETTAKWVAYRWLLAAAIVFGCSVWSLHFVAMLAFMPNVPIAYSPGLTVASILIAAVGAMVALLAWRLLPYKTDGALVGGILLGFSVASMHYTGVAAMRLPGRLLFDPAYVFASVLVSALFGILAVARSRSLGTIARRAEVTACLALSICGMHFTGMAALTIIPDPLANYSEGVLGSTTLAYTVGIVSLAILVASLSAALMGQHLSQRALQELSRMRLLSNLAHEALLIHRGGIVLEMNSAGARMLGLSVESVIGRPLEDFFADGSTAALARWAHTGPAGVPSAEMEIRTVTGVHVPVEVSSQSIEFQGKAAMAVALRDLSGRRRDEALIRHLAHHDSLTDLPNRFLLQERLARALDAATQDGTGVAVLYLDLDRFKPVNDLLGHAAGDALLVQVTKRLLAEIRAVDTLARIGGDEFVILLTDAEVPDKVSALATRLIEHLRCPFEIEGQHVEIGASIGIALYPSDGANSETLLRAADTAMYRVKEEGRGALRFFEASMHAQLQARRQLEQELCLAVERDELLLLYQPVVNCRTREIETFEALIRWDHPERGLIPPAEFISVAEQTDLISQIGEWVITKACEAATAWPQPWRVAVNISPVQFRHSDVPSLVARALERHRLDPRRFVVEITEGVFIADAEKAVVVLSKLREQGVRLALDDFGVGYSSLSYLQIFTFDKIKIDRSFVNKLQSDGDAFKIIRAITNLGHNLGLTVTVEGVETEQQVTLLQSLGCDQLQGYLFGRPAPIETFCANLDQTSVSPGRAGAVRRFK